MTSPRIAYLTSEYPAPSHTFIRREVEALRARSLNIETFSIRRPAADARFGAADQEALRTTTYLLPVRPLAMVWVHVLAALRHPWAYAATLRLALQHRVPGARSLLWSLFHFAEAIALAARLSVSKIDHIHNHFANSSANVGLLASRFLGIKWSLTLHGTVDWDYPCGYLLPEKIRIASFVACVSYFGRAQALRFSPPAQWPKIFVVHCGVDLSVFPARRCHRPTAGRLRVVTVGRLAPEKGQLGLLEAFAAVSERGVDAELRVLGEGPLRAALTKSIADLGLTGRCVLVGQQTEAEVLEELADADLFVLSSFMEGFPVVLMESLGMRVPVIAPCVAGIPELVRGGETGLLFIAGNWDQLAAQLERAARDSELRQRLAEQGHRQVVEQFEIHRAVEPLVERFLSEA